MSGATLAVTAVVHAAVATSFLLVATVIYRRRVPGTKNATAAILVWWSCLAFYLYLQAGLHAWDAWAGPSFEAHLWSRFAAIPLLCSAAGGLTYYVLYLLTGRGGLRVPVALLYFGTAVLFHVASFTPPPTGLRVTAWLVELETSSSLTPVVFALVGLPPILGSVALLAVARRMEPPQRYRAVLVASGILAYIGSGLMAFLGTSAVFKLVALNGMGLLAGLLVLAAYYPPEAMRRRYGIATASELERLAAARRRKQREFSRRGTELV